MEELFWFWPVPRGKEGKDKALEALGRGSWLDAVDLWRMDALQRNSDGVALHNLAVFFHAMALDLEASGQSAALSAKQAKERDVWWKEAYASWRQLRDHSGFWKLFRERLEKHLPGQSHAAVADRVQASILQGVASINGQLARHFHGIEDEWDRQLTLLAASGYAVEDLVGARRLAAEPVLGETHAAISETLKRTTGKAEAGLAEALGLLDRIPPRLAMLAQVLPVAEVQALHDQAADAAMTCLVAFGNATGQWSALLGAGDAALAIAQGQSTRARLNKQLTAFRTNYSSQVRGERSQRLDILSARCRAIFTSERTNQEKFESLRTVALRELPELVAAMRGDQEFAERTTGIVARAFVDLAGTGQDRLLAWDALGLAGSISQDRALHQEIEGSRLRIQAAIQKRQQDEAARVERPLPSLMATAHPEVYQRNVFRVTGLSVLATERELSRHIDKVTRLESLGRPNAPVGGPLAVQTPPDTDALKVAVQRLLHDAEHRILEELFWIWPLPVAPQGHTDRPHFDTKEELEVAQKAWAIAGSQNLDRGISAHNFAVVHHALALDLELRKRTTPLSAQETAVRDAHWLKAFRNWCVVVETPVFWEHLCQRIEHRPDPRLDRRFAARIRQSLPEALLSIASKLAEKGQHDHQLADVGRLIKLISSSGFDPDSVRAATGALARSLRASLLRNASQANKDVKSRPLEGLQIAQALLSAAATNLTLLEQLLDPGDPVLENAHDEIGLAALGGMDVFCRQTKNWHLVAGPLQAALRISRGRAAREQIQNSLDIAKQQLVYDCGRKLLDSLAERARAIVESNEPPEVLLGQFESLVHEQPSDQDRALFADPEFVKAYSNLLAGSLRSLGLKVNNDHEKYDLSLKIISLAKTLCRDAELAARLEQDGRTVSENAAAATKRQTLDELSQRCAAIRNGAQSNADKLAALRPIAETWLPQLVRDHYRDAEFLVEASNIVGYCLRAVSIALHNDDKDFASAVAALNLARQVARSTELLDQLRKDLAAAEASMQQAAVSGANRNSTCFIATAAYGSEMSEEVTLLRDYRDRVLRRSSGGRLLIRTYNALAPPLARAIARRRRLRLLARYALQPVVELCRTRSQTTTIGENPGPQS